MTATRSFCVRLLALTVCLVCVCARPSAAQELSKEIAGIISRSRLGAAGVSVCIVDVPTGRVLGSHRENERMIPASNLKVLTSAAALGVLGPSYEFRTQFERHGDRLVIRASGDPAFADPVLLEQMNLSVEAFVDRLVESITKTGVKRCDEIIVDDRVFDRAFVHPDWPRDQLDKGYCAEVSGLNFHANVLRIFASPAARESELALISTEPSGGGIEVRARAKTVRGTNRSTMIGALREGDQNIFTISGTVNAPLRDPAETTLHQPAMVFARILAERLARAGVVAGDPLAAGASGKAAPCRLVSLDEDLGEPDAVLAVVKTPISVVLERCNQDSENLYAESLLKVMGRTATGQPGSWLNGAAVVRLQVRDRVSPEAAAALNLADGSGMSRANKVTSSILAQWLAAVARDTTIGPAFVDSLPRARAEGTMKRRFLDKSPINEVCGKSGLLNGVRTLSGYVTDSDANRRIAYSVLVNDIPPDVTAARVKTFHEEVVMAVDRYLARLSGNEVQERLGGGESRFRKK